MLTRCKMIVNYIWVGTNDIPDVFMYNYNNTASLNADEHTFRLWRDSDIESILGEYTDLYTSMSLYHKLQIAKYLICDYGGVYCDFDIEWYVPFAEIRDVVGDYKLILPKRKSLYFFSHGQKTTLIDDFVIMASPHITKQFLQFCLQRTERKDQPTEPFSVYALTEWTLQNTSVGYLTPNQIYDTAGCIFGYHANNRTWN